MAKAFEVCKKCRRGSQGFFSHPRTGKAWGSLFIAAAICLCPEQDQHCSSWPAKHVIGDNANVGSVAALHDPPPLARSLSRIGEKHRQCEASLIAAALTYV
ncbi:hypothetical protein LR48_Vigan10g205100 [Vigna angularis]|uniref:Uncharacterized protein n=1 Tax=Phaseolus angularis TaxID=3914 RepID=A0A0L9VN34_PHAAN|nr:hypothetical protein LR48_Vigan10g205100 [Vigna angularis]